jgi:hypothetical protein
MWADSMISVFTMIAVTTKNLIAGRIARILQPLVKFGPVVKEAVRFPELASIVVDMIKCQKHGFGFSATGADVATIGPDRLILKAIVVVKAMLAVFRSVVKVPLCSPFDVTRPGMVSSVIPKPVTGTGTPFNTIVVKAFLTLATVPVILVFRLVTFGTGFNHGFTSVIKMLSDYGINVKGKVQRPSGNGVGSSDPKRIAPRTGEDMVCSAWEHAAVSFETA